MDYQKHYWDCLDHNMKLDAQIKQLKIERDEARAVARRLLNDPTYLHRCYQRAGLISEDINWDDIEMITADVVKRAFG